MKKIVLISTISIITLILTACFKPKVPEDWYTESLNYYQEGFACNWSNEEDDYYIIDELKDPDTEFGYLLRDLDGDGANELLIGIIDDAPETKFTDILIWHSDIGPFRILSGGDGYYIYLCDDNVIKMDKWYGSQTLTDYMEYNSDNNSFTILDPAPAVTPGKYELTPFN